MQAADKEVEVQAADDSSKETEGGGPHYLLHPVHHYHLLGAWEARQGSQRATAVDSIESSVTQVLVPSRNRVI